MMKCLTMMIITVVTAESIVYELWPDVNDVAVNISTIEKENVPKPYLCARLCHRNRKCAVFGYNVITGSCGLHEDIMFKEYDLQNHLEGQRFFFMRKAPCPRRKDFLASPSTGPFVWYSKKEETAIRAKESCERVCGRLVALSNDDKMDAVLDTLDAIELADQRMIVGGSDSKTEGVFLWSDGSPVPSNKFREAEPNGGLDENCLMVHKRRLFDVNCEMVFEGSICEIVN